MHMKYQFVRITESSHEYLNMQYLGSRINRPAKMMINEPVTMILDSQCQQHPMSDTAVRAEQWSNNEVAKAPVPNVYWSMGGNATQTER